MTIIPTAGLLRAFIQQLSRTRGAAPTGAPGESGSRLSLTLAQAALDDWLARRDRPQPLQVAVIGPTQAGKSTVVNLLLGGELARSSSLAAFTDKLHGFVQAADGSDLSWIEGVLDDPLATLQSAPAAHSLASIIWDTPDFDSHRSQEYRPAIARVAALADVLLLVVSKEKYSDMSVWRTLEVLKPLQRRLVVCLNKVSPDQQVLLEALRMRLEEAGWNVPEVPVIPLPYVLEENAFDALRGLDPVARLSETVLQPDNACGGHARLEGVRAVVRENWQDWVRPVEAEIEASEHWREQVDAQVDAAMAGYSSQYLDHAGRNEAFDRAIIQLLELLEIPGIARPLARVRGVLTWPVRKLIDAFNLGGPAAHGAGEDTILTDVVDHALLSLNGVITRMDADAAQARFWWQSLQRVYGTEADAVRRRFADAVVRYRADFEPEIEQAAHSLYAGLQQNPVTLNALRATRVGADAAAVLVAVKTGTVGVSEALLTPAILSLTSALTEGAVGTYVHTVRDQLKDRQRTLVGDLLQQHVRTPLAAVDEYLRDDALYHMDRKRLERMERVKAEVLG